MRCNRAVVCPTDANTYHFKIPITFLPMNTRELLSTAKYLASTKPSFRLSELREYLTDESPLLHLYRILAPHLPRLDMVATEIDGDYEISRIQKSAEYLLTDDEKRKIDAFLATRHIPAALERAIEQYISKKVGKPWDDPVIVERLRRAIVAQKDDYWKVPRKRLLAYTKGYSVLGYLAYHFPVYFMQTEHILYTIASAGLLKPSMTVLDVGTGPGVVPLAIANFYSRLDRARATVASIERSEEHIEAFAFLAQSFSGSSSKVTIDPPIKADIRSLPVAALPDRIDLLVFSNVLNELEDLPTEQRADLVMQLAHRLANDGSILIVEPAEELTATRLRLLSLKLAERGLSIHSPCSFLWGTRCNPARCWTFTTQSHIKPTRLMELLAACDEPYRYINTDIKYAYVILRRDKRVLHPYRVPPRSKFSRLSKLHLHVNRRINVIAAKMSQELGGAKTHVFRLCDGTAGKPVYGVLPAYHRNPANELILTIPYGAIIELHNVLVRYNKAHGAYNLFLNRNSQVIGLCQ